MYIVEYYGMVREFLTIEDFIREWFYTYEDCLEDSKDMRSKAPMDLKEIYESIISDDIDAYEKEKDWNGELECYEWIGYNIFPPKEAF